MSKLKSSDPVVLVVGPMLNAGGISRFIEDLLNAGLKFNLKHFNTIRPPKRSTKKGAVGYKALFAGGYFWALRNACITLRNIGVFPYKLITIKPALVHIATSSHWSFWESSVYLWWARIFRVKVVLHFLGDFESFYNNAGRLERKMIGIVFRSAYKVIVLSNSVAKIVANSINISDVRILPSFVNIEQSQKTGNKVEIDRTEKIILFMGGNYGARKGVYDIVQIVPDILDQHGQARIYFCGSGDVEDAYKSIDKNYYSRTKYLGMVDNDTKINLLNEAFMYVLPSYSEGIPYGIMEAMAHGLPIVTTNVGGIPEVLENTANGFLVQPGDLKTLEQSILYLLNNPAEAMGMGKLNMKKIEQKYSSQSALRAITAIYTEILNM